MHNWCYFCKYRLDAVLFLLICASFSWVSWDVVEQCMATSDLFYDQPRTDRHLQEVYVQYAQSCASSQCAGYSCLSAVHFSLQEHALRYDVHAAMCSSADARLRAVLRAVLALLGSCSPLHAQDALHSTLYTLSGIYQHSEDVSGRTGSTAVPGSVLFGNHPSVHDQHRPSNVLDSFDVMQWYEQSLGALCRPTEETHESTRNPLLFPHSLPRYIGLYPSIRLTWSFFDYLKGSASTAACSAYRLLLDAYVHCVHKIPQDPDWIVMNSYFPFLIRMSLELSLQQCTDDPNPSWPSYLLLLVGRDDLCGRASVAYTILSSLRCSEQLP